MAFNPLAAVQEGYDFAQGLRDDRTRRQAGNALAGGDYQGASNAFNQAGMIDQGVAVQRLQQQQEDRQRDLQYEQEDRAKSQRKEQLEFMLQAGTMLSRVAKERGPEELVRAYDQLTPVFRAMGADDAQLGQVKQAIVANPAALDAIVGQVQQELKFFSTPEGIVGVAPDGQADLVYRSQAKPEWKERTNPDGSTEWFDINEGVRGAPAVDRGEAVNIASLTGVVNRAVPGARITSGQRSASDNARVGGVANSYHLSGQAVDVVPPQGMSMGQLAAGLKQQFGAGFDIINEGDHVHVEPSRRPRTIKGDAPQTEKPLSPKQAADMSLRVAGQFNGLPDVKDYNVVANSYEQVSRLATKANPTPADDMALTYSIMKMLDPNSVVRETEYAMVARTAGMPDQVVMGIQQLVKGKALTPQIRSQLVQAADTVFASKQARYNQLVQQYQSLGNQAGVIPGTIQPRVAPPRPRQTQTTTSKPNAPRPGTVEGGYRFKGGDPSKPTSWEKVR